MSFSEKISIINMTFPGKLTFLLTVLSELEKPYKDNSNIVIVSSNKPLELIYIVNNHDGSFSLDHFINDECILHVIIIKDHLLSVVDRIDSTFTEMRLFWGGHNIIEYMF
jgi:hypothetical protein